LFILIPVEPVLRVSLIIEFALFLKEPSRVLLYLVVACLALTALGTTLQQSDFAETYAYAAYFFLAAAAFLAIPLIFSFIKFQQATLFKSFIPNRLSINIVFVIQYLAISLALLQLILGFILNIFGDTGQTNVVLINAYWLFISGVVLALVIRLLKSRLANKWL
jgi:hypothetical protein